METARQARRKQGSRLARKQERKAPFKRVLRAQRTGGQTQAATSQPGKSRKQT